MIDDSENEIIFWDSSESLKESVVDVGNINHDEIIERDLESSTLEFEDNNPDLDAVLETEGTDDSEDLVSVYGKKYYKISEVESLIGESQSTIRFWDDSFADLGRSFCSQRSRGGTRKFTKENIENLKMLKLLLRERRLTIEGAISEIKNNKKRNSKEKALVLLMETRDDLNALIEAYNCVLHQKC